MNRCLLCESILRPKPSWQGLIGIGEQEIICEKCSNSFERADIENRTVFISSITSLYHYNDAMKAYLHQFKFLQDIALGAVFKKPLRTVLKGKPNIVPIPVHENRRISRTFSQVEALLKPTEIPYLSVLEKLEDVTMSEKTKEERLATDVLFQVKRGQVIRPETYILVDDIFTTGTTVNQAAKVLLDAGATKVEAVTLIRA